MNKFYIVNHYDPGAGFSVLITYALNGIIRANELNMIPVIDYSNRSVMSHFYSPEHGENFWEYFFHPVAGVGSVDIKNGLDNNSISEDHVCVGTKEDAMRWHHWEEDRIAAFWGSDEPSNSVLWMKQKRIKGRKFVKDYIKVKEHILDKVDNFYKDIFLNIKVLGIQIRGSDFFHAEPTSPQRYFDEIYRLENELGLYYDKFFLATDQVQLVKCFKDKYGSNRIITYDAARTDSELAVFKKNICPYKKGEDVLIDILLLSHCHYLLKCASAVGEYALWFNPSLKCSDFAIESNYDPTFSGDAFSKLNLGNKSQNEWDEEMTLIRNRKNAIKVRRRLLSALMKGARLVIPIRIRTILWNSIGRYIY